MAGTLSPCVAAGPGEARGEGARAAAVEAREAEAPKTRARGRLLRDPLQSMSIFKNYSVNNFNLFDGEVVEVSDEPENAQVEAAPAVAEVKTEAKESARVAEVPAIFAGKLKRTGPVFVDNFKKEDLLDPEKTPRIRINPEAPAPFIGMALANAEGDKDLAARYALQMVTYQQNMIYEIQELTALLGEALIRKQQISERDWDGMEQLIDYEQAKAAENSGSLLRSTHENSMKRIKADSKGRADIYFFFDLSCTYCRFMAPDVERLWQVVKRDPNVRMTGVTLGKIPDGWIEEFRRYTGVTFPINDGTKVAQSFHIKLLPAVIVLAPTENKAYVKSGQSSFLRLYEFTRRVQGLPATITADVQRLVNTPIGEEEVGKKARGQWKMAQLINDERNGLHSQAVEVPKSQKKVMVERF